jgi:hypothetical protein
MSANTMTDAVQLYAPATSMDALQGATPSVDGLNTQAQETGRCTSQSCLDESPRVQQPRTSCVVERPSTFMSVADRAEAISQTQKEHPSAKTSQ